MSHIHDEWIYDEWIFRADTPILDILALRTDVFCLSEAGRAGPGYLSYKYLETNTLSNSNL